MNANITETIIKLRAENTSIVNIAKKLELAYEEVENTLNDKDNKRRIKEVEDELLVSRKREYERIYRKSIKTLKDILNTPHEIDVFDKDKNCVGTKIDASVLKAKKDIASELLESMNIKKQKAGGIHINNAMVNHKEKESKTKRIQHHREVKQILGECTIEEGEKKCKEIMYANSE